MATVESTADIAPGDPVAGAGDAAESSRNSTPLTRSHVEVSATSNAGGYPMTQQGKFSHIRLMWNSQLKDENFISELWFFFERSAQNSLLIWAFLSHGGYTVTFRDFAQLPHKLISSAIFRMQMKYCIFFGNCMLLFLWLSFRLLL